MPGRAAGSTRGSLLAAGSLGVHELRYRVAYGAQSDHAHEAHGHGDCYDRRTGAQVDRSANVREP